ncbi:E3 ubiquitin- ligase MIB1-like [Brachionus plicatilis]|uniref:E3 ubiquitin-ligase MIB1-like n=1 Tax=Brachionus plicatilis TaxID=10195 RepID=A0A3M7RVV8_BRAPC|nr:E3 ubiquitin- ligase MIB1-like [Brachionus plicatilis]
MAYEGGRFTLIIGDIRVCKKVVCGYCTKEIESICKNAMRLIIIKLIQIKKYWLIDERKQDGFSALHLACLNNHFELVKVLVENGNLNINIKNDADQTPLHLAIDRLNFDIIKLLCTYKYPTDNKIRCNLNAQNKEGDSPLHCLLKNFSFSQLINKESKIKEKYLSIACFLIENGADVFLKNKSDQIPFDFCFDFEVVKFLFNFSIGLNRRFEQFFINENSSGNRIVKFCNEDYDICVFCLKKRRDILLKPCNHILVCDQCSVNCFKCFRCDCFVKETVRIGFCVICKNRMSSYLFEPCGHMIMCSECARTVKYCTKCKRLIEKLVSYKEVCSMNIHLANEQIILDLKRYITKLKELNYLKDRATCPLCKEAINNVIFFCGHSTCNACG